MLDMELVLSMCDELESIEIKLKRLERLVSLIVERCDRYEENNRCKRKWSKRRREEKV